MKEEEFFEISFSHVFQDFNSVIYYKATERSKRTRIHHPNHNTTLRSNIPFLLKYFLGKACFLSPIKMIYSNLSLT